MRSFPPLDFYDYIQIPLFFFFSNNTLCEQSEIFLFNNQHLPLLILNFIFSKRMCKDFCLIVCPLVQLLDRCKQALDAFDHFANIVDTVFMCFHRYSTWAHSYSHWLHWMRTHGWGIWILRDGNHCPPVPPALRTLPHIPMLRPTFHYISQGIVCLSTYIEGINLRLRCSSEGLSLRIYTSCTRTNHSDTFFNRCDNFNREHLL